MVLGFPGPEAGASLKQTWKTWKTWKTSFFHGFGLPRPGGRNTAPLPSAKQHARTRLRGRVQHARATRCHGGCRSKFETDLENQENLENQFFSWFWASQARKPEQV